ncbi:hypothetical protein [Cylindrospermopsis raciborskii]|uniref:hypothetical protein n=1 Tax=Cylindrospermopsis raciborskii TaxID=77022 RepID=UPI0038D02DCA
MFNLIILSGLATMLREHITLEIYFLPIEQFDYAIASNLIALEDINYPEIPWDEF